MALEYWKTMLISSYKKIQQPYIDYICKYNKSFCKLSCLQRATEDRGFPRHFWNLPNRLKNQKLISCQWVVNHDLTQTSRLNINLIFTSIIAVPLVNEQPLSAKNRIRCGASKDKWLTIVSFDSITSLAERLHFRSEWGTELPKKNIQINCLQL